MKRAIMLLTLVAVVVLPGCGYFDRYVVSNIKGHAKECIEGVSYLQFPSGVTVQYDTDGKIKTCK